MEDISLFLRALHFAADRHRDQRRKGAGASPYINHPIYVAQLLSEVGGVEDIGVLCAAVLHDTVEDTETSEEELRREFGSRIARIVAEVTDDKSLPKVERKRLQVDHAAHISREGALVKVADKIANVQDIASDPPHWWDQQRCEQYLSWAQAVVENCHPDNAALERCFAEALASARRALAANGGN